MLVGRGRCCSRYGAGGADSHRRELGPLLGWRGIGGFFTGSYRISVGVTAVLDGQRLILRVSRLSQVVLELEGWKLEPASQFYHSGATGMPGLHHSGFKEERISPLHNI